MSRTQTEIFSIRQMIDLTGLSEFTIRGWESRYSAFKPLRSDTGRREYRKSDVERALLLRELIERGHKIGSVAKLTNQALLELFEKTETSDLSAKGENHSREVIRAIELMSLQKWHELKIHFSAVNKKNPSQLIADFFLPCLKMLAEKVKRGSVSIAQEHIFSSFLKEKIYAALSSLESKNINQKKSSKVRFVLATPEGDYHEIGLLLAHLLIRSKGFNSLYLGPNSPSQELAETSMRFNSSHILIVSSVEKKGGAKHELLTFISEVKNRVGVHSQLFVAGNQTPLISESNSKNFVALKTFCDLEACLDQIIHEGGV